MELEEAEKIIKNSFLFKDANEHIQLKEAISTVLQANELARKSLIKNSNIADERNDLLVEVQRFKDKPYGFGLIVGTKRERDYWRNKIKEKIEELDKNEMLMKYNYEQVKIAIDILNELLKGE